MGIPSYFRKIIQKYPSIVSHNVMDKKAKYLCFDFNCLIYRCIRAPSMSGLPAVTMSDADSVVAWEDALLKEVKATVKEVWGAAGKPAGRAECKNSPTTRAPVQVCVAPLQHKCKGRWRQLGFQFYHARYGIYAAVD